MAKDAKGKVQAFRGPWWDPGIPSVWTHAHSCTMMEVDSAPGVKANAASKAPVPSPQPQLMAPTQPDKGGRLAPLLCLCQPGSPRHVGCTVGPC